MKPSRAQISVITWKIYACSRSSATRVERTERVISATSPSKLCWASHSSLFPPSPDTTVKLQLRDVSEHFSQATAIAGRSKQFHDCEFIKWRKMHWKSLIENCKIDFIHSSQPTWTFCIILVHKSTFRIHTSFFETTETEKQKEKRNFPFFVITFYHSISPHKSLFLSGPLSFTPTIDRETSDRAMKT